MPLGIRLIGRSTSKFVFILAALIAAGLWAQSTMRSDEPARVMGTTIWSGALSFPSGYTVAAGQTVELNPNADTYHRSRRKPHRRGDAPFVAGPRLHPRHPVHGHHRDELRRGRRCTACLGQGPLGDGSRQPRSQRDAEARLDPRAGTLANGATTATLTEAATGWQVGDEVLISPTENPNVLGFSTHHETRTLTSVSGSNVGFAALTYPHPQVTVKPGVSYGAEIVNLTRNMRIQGLDATHRTHVWIKSSQPQMVRYVAIANVGPQKNGLAIIGRYGLHFHRSGKVRAVRSSTESSCGSQALSPSSPTRRTGSPSATRPRSTPRGRLLERPRRSEAPNDTVYDRALAAYIGRPLRRTPSASRLLPRKGSREQMPPLRHVRRAGRRTPPASRGRKAKSEYGLSRTPSLTTTSVTGSSHGRTVPRSRDHSVHAYYNGNSGIEHGAIPTPTRTTTRSCMGTSTAGVQLHAESKALPATADAIRADYVDGAR